MEQKMRKVGDGKRLSCLSYSYTVNIYQAQKYLGCPLKGNAINENNIGK
jgi:hypothetical protein